MADSNETFGEWFKNQHWFVKYCLFACVFSFLGPIAIPAVIIIACAAFCWFLVRLPFLITNGKFGPD